MAETSVQNMTNQQKAALVFLLLEEKGAANLFDHMTDAEIKSIGNILLEMEEIPVDDLNQVLSEFYEDLGIQVSHFSGKRIFEKLVDKTLSPERRGKILSVEEVKGGTGSEFNPLEGIFSDLSNDQIYCLIKSEHPQTIAVILTLLRPGASKKIINIFKKDLQVDLLYRMSILSKIPENMINLMAENYKAKLADGFDFAGELGSKAVDVPGTDIVLRYLKTQTWDKAEEIISQIEMENSAIAKILRKKFFTVADLQRSDNNGIRNLLKNVEAATLSVVLKGQNEKIRNMFFQNMSTRAATIMKEDMEVMPEQKPEDLEAATELILEEAKKLISDGQMVLDELIEE